MNNNDYIRLVASKSVELHNRCNEAIEEIIRGREGKEIITKLADSIQYITEDILRIINR